MKSGGNGEYIFSYCYDICSHLLIMYLKVVIMDYKVWLFTIASELCNEIGYSYIFCVYSAKWNSHS